MWAALMRCEKPADLGLTEDQMLKLPDGKPYLAEFSGLHYYILDFTQPAVAKVLGDLARGFMRRYKPDLLKFDFGYELPAVGIAAPLDKNWTGERLMLKGLEVVIKAMREENPDLVVMYYNLSPLFLDYFDLHSTDDLDMAAGEYDLEANRRIFFSSLLGPLGVPTYGSSGYDWASAPNIWFDLAAVGTLGSLNDFKGDEQGEGAAADFIAKYNGPHASSSPHRYSSKSCPSIPSPKRLRAAHMPAPGLGSRGAAGPFSLPACPTGRRKKLTLALLREADPRVKGIVQALGAGSWSRPRQASPSSAAAGWRWFPMAVARLSCAAGRVSARRSSATILAARLRMNWRRCRRGS